MELNRKWRRAECWARAFLGRDALAYNSAVRYTLLCSALWEEAWRWLQFMPAGILMGMGATFQTLPQLQPKVAFEERWPPLGETTLTTYELMPPFSFIQNSIQRVIDRLQKPWTLKKPM